MRKNRVVEQNRCCHLIRRRAHRAFFLTDEGQNRAVALMRRVEAGVQAGMSYCINRAVSISSFDPRQITDALYNDVKSWYDLKMSKPGEKGDFCKFYP